MKSPQVLRRRPKGRRFQVEAPERSSIVLDCGPHFTSGDGRQKRLVILFDLVSIGFRVPGHGAVELVAAPEIPGNLRCVARAGVSTGQHAGAERRVVREPVGIEPLDRNRGFHVPKLAHIEIASSELRPAEERIAGSLHDALSGYDPLAIVWERAPGQVRLEDGRWRLLELEEQRIIRAGTLQQQDVGSEPDAADTHYFAGYVGDVVPIQEEAPINGQ